MDISLSGLGPTLHPDWKPLPYWWDGAPLTPADAPMPSRVDVAIVGAGYCGLHAARTLAANGANVVVLDGGDPGFGASSRNHGMLSGGLKIPAGLEQRLGKPWADAIQRTAFESFAYLKTLIRDEALDIDYVATGRFIGAHSPKAYESLKARRDNLETSYGYHARMVSRDAQRAEVGSDFYYGGLVIDEVSGMHPAKLHRAVLELAERAGATVCGNAEVRAIGGSDGRFTLDTARGKVSADKVLIATNAYSGAFNDTMFPWLRRRLIPVTAYMMATEELPEVMAAQMLPTNRMCGDTKRSLFAFRLSPDRRRLIFAARAKFRDIREADATPILHKFASSVWPELHGYRISHCWKGLVAFTFDQLPHLGVHNGVYYAAGCQGNGVSIMSYLGHQAALKMLSGSERQCGHDGVPFPTRPTYTGDPWFLPAIGAYYKSRDALDRLFVQ